ncbi:putative adenylyltransferase/sulfurtransferase MoeZ [Prochlorococcus sp. MIT 1306]|nr:putative adenylyltransferase/sulfurtransferase MoeZ [Prochlorococcus sp. MIT 1306]
MGSGGLGSPLLLYFAAAGVGRLGVVDFDVVDQSNLQRQVIHGTSWIGKPKVESAKARIQEINPHCQVDLVELALNKDNALEIILPYDIACDCSDNFPTRYLLNDACVMLGKPNVYGAVLRFDGQALVFNLTTDSPNYRDLVPELPALGLIPSCAEGGVMGVLPGLIGVIQATKAIKIITCIGSRLDVLEHYEYEIPSIIGAELISLSSIENGDAIARIRELVIGLRLFVYCKAGARSKRALLE